jgi:hypothetical protein
MHGHLSRLVDPMESVGRVPMHSKGMVGHLGSGLQLLTPVEGRDLGPRKQRPPPGECLRWRNHVHNPVAVRHVHVSTPQSSVCPDEGLGG